MAEIVIINPRFDTSFWSLEHCMQLFGKRANLPVACLALLAALVPDHHEVTLIEAKEEAPDGVDGASSVPRGGNGNGESGPIAMEGISGRT